MSDLTEILSAEQIDELYSAGFRIIPAAGDPLDLPAALIKPDWAYQWNDSADEGWYWVKFEDHPGWFAPPGDVGPVVVQGLGLFRKLKVEVEEFHRQNKHKADKLVEDWADRFGMFTGGATTLQTDGEEVLRTEITAGKGVETKVETFERPQTKTVELVSKLPQDMLEHIDAIFAERDRIKDDLIEEVGGRQLLKHDVVDYQCQAVLAKFWDATIADKGAPWWPTLHAIILPYAIENVRAKLKESAS